MVNEMSTTSKGTSTGNVKEAILAFEGFKWWQSFIAGFILFLIFSSLSTSWLLLAFLGVAVGFVSGRKVLMAALITAGSLSLSWLLLYLVNMVFSNFKTLEAADALLAIATGSSGLGIVFVIIALIFSTLLGLTTGAFGSVLFQEWKLIKATYLQNE